MHIENETAKVSEATLNIALITIDTCLADEIGGINRFPYIADVLCKRGHTVDLITSCFQHWKKKQRFLADKRYEGTPYRIVFVDQPSYERNIDPKRIYAYHVAAKNIEAFLEGRLPNVKPPEGGYDLVYANIPPNNIALTAARYAARHGIPVIGDVNDLWPEAMRMVLDVPIASELAFLPLSLQARGIYKRLDGVVATSDEYAERPYRSPHKKSLESRTVYVGTDLGAFDAEAEEYGRGLEKPEDETWFVYAGTLGTSYDLESAIKAMRVIKARMENNGALSGIRLKIIGDGPDRDRLESLARTCKVEGLVSFTGYVPHGVVAAYLTKADAALNTFVRKAPQSIPTKIADYLAGGCAVINTSGSEELRHRISEYGCGMTVDPEQPGVLADAMCSIAVKGDKREKMKECARKAAERFYDRRATYSEIADFCEEIAGCKRAADLCKTKRESDRQ